MTDKTALRQLIEAVEAGLWDGSWRWLIDHIWDIDHCTPFSEAYHGSLDAAKALHEALLPGWAVKLWAIDDDDADAEVYPPIFVPVGWSGRTEGVDTFKAWVEGYNPARAWLIAILKAYEAQK